MRGCPPLPGLCPALASMPTTHRSSSCSPGLGCLEGDVGLGLGAPSRIQERPRPLRPSCFQSCTYLGGVTPSPPAPNNSQATLPGDNYLISLRS